MMLIRDASPDGADAVAAVYLASRREFVAFAPLAHPDAEVRSWIRAELMSTGNFTVAVFAGQVVGFLGVAKRVDYRWINHLYLLPGWTGRGIGTLLLDRAISELPPPIRLYTFQANDGARRFYERRGFRAIAFGDGSGNEEKCPDVLYEWREPAS